MYLKLDGKCLAPKFLGYITEDNGMGTPREIAFLLQKVEGHHALSLRDLPICLTALRKFHAITGCCHGAANRGNFIVKPDGSGALIIDFTFAREGPEESMQSEVEILEECLKEDDESKRKMGEEKVIEEDPRDRIGDMKPMTDGEDQRRDKIGVDAWVEEKLQERLKEQNQDS
jgi:hypothetical protein